MERYRSYAVDIIKSGSGVNIYSALTRGNFIEGRKEHFKSIEDSEDRLAREIRNRSIFRGTFNHLIPAEQIVAGLIVLRNAIAEFINPRDGRVEDFLPVFVLIGTFIVSSLASHKNNNELILAELRLAAVEGSKKANLPQHQEVFDLN